MIERIKNLPVARKAWHYADRFQNALAPAILRKRTFGIAAIAILGAIVYWGLLASDRYVSEARVVIERTDMAASATMDLGSLLTGATGGHRSDQLLLRTHLQSVDMLNKLEQELNLRAHYSSSEHDILSRMGKDVALEHFHQYFLSRVSIELDEYSGVLVIKAQAYDPETARKIAAALVREGEKYMNELGHAMARDQVEFLEKQVERMSQQALQKRQELLDFQNRKGMLSPQALAESRQATINRLESQAIDYKARRAALLGYLTPQAAGVVELDLQIAAIEKQIAEEQSRLTSSKGQPLNTAVEEYQRLEMAARFAEDTYKTALVALEKGRLEALRTLKKVSVLQTPSLPQYPLEPRRIYNVIVFALAALIFAAIIQLLAAIIRDHQD